MLVWSLRKLIPDLKDDFQGFLMKKSAGSKFLTWSLLWKVRKCLWSDVEEWLQSGVWIGLPAHDRHRCRQCCCETEGKRVVGEGECEGQSSECMAVHCVHTTRLQRSEMTGKFILLWGGVQTVHRNRWTLQAVSQNKHQLCNNIKWFVVFCECAKQNILDCQCFLFICLSSPFL